MASATRRRTGYSTYGNVAYDPNYLGNTVVETGGSRVLRPQDQPLVRPKERVHARTRLQVRTQQAVSPFAITGFLAVAALAVVLLMSYVKLDQVSDQVVALRDQLSVLETEEASLLARYEQTFDMKAIEQQAMVEGGMSAPTSDQIIYLDLSEPDSAVVYGQEKSSGLQGLADSARGVLEGLKEYFR